MVGPTRASLLPRARRTLACQQGFRGGGVRRGWARGRRVERTPPNRVGPPPKGRVVQLDFDVCRPYARVTAASGKSAWCVSRLGVGPEEGRLCTCARGAAERACGPYAAAVHHACKSACSRALHGPVVPLRRMRAAFSCAVLRRAVACGDGRRLIRRVISSCTS